MAKKSRTSAGRWDSRKRRTRGHVIADLALVHVQYFLVNAGFTSEVVTRDYGYDLSVVTFDRDGLIEPGVILVQLKAAETLSRQADGRHFVFDLDVRDYHLWRKEPNPVFLILYEASARRAYWLYFQRHLKSGAAPTVRAGARTTRIKIPSSDRVTTDFFRHARHLKARAVAKLWEADPHG